MLDVLFEANDYPQIIEVPVNTQWIKTDGTDTTVKVPSIESICGDKLTAFAPNTTGILYNKGKELEIIKQLFDLGHLFDGIDNFEVVSNSFSAIVEKELKYKGLNISKEAVLNDTIETALMLTRRENNAEEPHKSNFKELKGGVQQFKGYLMSGNFNIDEVIESAAKVAYIATKIKKADHSALKKYDSNSRRSIKSSLKIPNSFSSTNYANEKMAPSFTGTTLLN